MFRGDSALGAFFLREEVLSLVVVADGEDTLVFQGELVGEPAGIQSCKNVLDQSFTVYFGTTIQLRQMVLVRPEKPRKNTGRGGGGAAVELFADASIEGAKSIFLGLL